MGKPQVLVLTKADAVQNPATQRRVAEYAEERGLPCRIISAVTGEGLQDLVREVMATLDRLRGSASSRGTDLP